MTRWVKFLDSGKSELTLRASSSGTVQAQLLSGTVGLDLSTVGTVEMWLKDKGGGTASFTTAGAGPKLTVTGTAAGSVSFLPGTGDLVAGSAPYHGYFRLRRSATSWDFVPESTEFTIDVRPTY